MESIRKVGKYSLNKGSLMAKGLFNVSDDLLVRDSDCGVSLWLDAEDKDELINLSDSEFKNKCKELLDLSNI